MIDFPLTPITEETFERQGWEKIIDNDTQNGLDGDSDEYYYFILPLPKDNPDENVPVLISSCNDEYQELGLKKGHYFVEIENMFGLGLSTSEEEIEILYRALTKLELEE